MTKLESWIVKRALTQEALAALIGVSHQSAHRYLCGKRRWPLAQALMIERESKGTVTVDDLLAHQRAAVTRLEHARGQEVDSGALQPSNARRIQKHRSKDTTGREVSARQARSSAARVQPSSLKAP